MVQRPKISEAILHPLGVRRQKASAAPTHGCSVVGCGNDGPYRAPRDRSLTSYVWLCLDHVRDYNRQWNYYEGMNAEQMEAEIRKDTTWQRPTWKLGSLGRKGANGRDDLHDPFGFFRDDQEAAEAESQRQRRKARTAPEESVEDKALRVMDLDSPFTLEQLKARYKELAKRHHPDLHPDEVGAEDRLKDIIEAYKTLRGRLNM